QRIGQLVAGILLAAGAWRQLANALEVTDGTRSRAKEGRQTDKRRAGPGGRQNAARWAGW
ncbi:hypothetical protein, partial [Streptococcus pneumoniae]|uniref:hypothetical protein n=1 Tax=Streptococcus pneumoniae TaxID=1313 RepID=UPI001E2C0BBD